MTIPLDTGAAPATTPGTMPAQRVALVDLLDRLLAGGVVISGDLVISIAEIDLVHVSLRALITSVHQHLDPDTANEEQP